MITDEQRRFWRQEHLFQTTGCCYGRVDSAVVTTAGSSLVVVVRGWLLHEERGILALRFNFQGGTFHGIPRIRREDVSAVFPGVKRALRSGFMVILSPSADPRMQDERELSFVGVTSAGQEFRGNFSNLEITFCGARCGVRAVHNVRRDYEKNVTRIKILVHKEDLDNLSEPLKSVSLLLENDGYNSSTVVVSSDEHRTYSPEELLAQHFHGQHDCIILLGLKALQFFDSYPVELVMQKTTTKVIYIPYGPEISPIKRVVGKERRDISTMHVDELRVYLSELS